MSEGKKRKICVVTANRADYTRIETAMREIKNHPDLELQLVVIGSHLLPHFGNTIDLIRSHGFHVDYELYMELDGRSPVTMTKSVGLAVNELATIFNNIKPDIVITVVDRFESFAVGTAAVMSNIFTVHTQGGEVTGTIDESIRHALTKMCHAHFVATEESRQRVIKMGEDPSMVFNTGCPGTDLLKEAPQWSAIETFERLKNYMKLTDIKLDATQPFFLIIQHPVTTEYGHGAEQILATLEAMKRISRQTIMLWPNIDAGSYDVVSGIKQYQTEQAFPLAVFKHLPSEFYINLMRLTACLIGNTSSGIRESCYFGTPVVNVGTRQQGRERCQNVIDAGYVADELETAIRYQFTHGRYEPEFIFGDGQAGRNMANLLASIDISRIQKRIMY